ncbi:hypothetical protein Csa_009795 [Cucumis sativus]|uniref:Uncharacterized protein n=1 Tax=Cucumis sativus TaxID=3659 RepID=A0A0A0L6Z5_CUCSA|nr:hypothetical protein Csa_009795 [Cucumis sativus]
MVGVSNSPHPLLDSMQDELKKVEQDYSEKLLTIEAISESTPHGCRHLNDLLSHLP